VYSLQRFADPEGYRQAVAAAETNYRRQLAEERAAKP
jgi:hypothetical protein